MLALEAIRIAEQSARAAEQSAASALATLERAEDSLTASERRMAEITEAASSAASEATEARLRATEVANEFRSLEERVSEALRVGVARGGAAADAAVKTQPPAMETEPPARSIAVSAAVPRGGSSPAGGTTAEFEALWDSFDRKADRIVQRLRELEARTMTVIRTPMPHAPTPKERR